MLPLYIYIYTHVHLNKLECHGKVIEMILAHI